MKDLQAKTYSVMLAPTAAATAVRTANLDCQGADYATIVVPLGAELNTNATGVAVQLSESDDTVATNFATFNASFNRTVDNTTGTIAVSHVDLRARKRYLRLTVTPATTTNDVVISSAFAILDKEIKDATSSSAPNVVVG